MADMIRPQVVPRGRPMQIRRPGMRKSVSRSATRALDVLELFGQLRHPLRAIEIATALELNPSTANQLLKTMVESAHLTFDGQTKAYQPSLRLVPFGAWLIGNYGASEHLGELVREVQRATGGIVTLTTPNDTFMQIIDTAGSDARIMATERGLSVPIFITAIGMAYLSTQSEPAIRRLADRARVHEADIDDLVLQARAIDHGRLASSEDTASGTSSMATPLPHAGQHAPLVLGLALPRARMAADHAALREAMLSAVARCFAPG